MCVAPGRMRGNGGRHGSSLALDRRGGSLVEYLIAVGLMAMLALAGVRRLGDGGEAKAQAHAACVEAIDCAPAPAAAPEPIAAAPAGAAAPPPRPVPPPPPPPREESWKETALGYGAAAAGGA